jgi:hypothetical protein
MLLIVATRYDEVTTRTFAVAEYLLQQGREREVETTVLFEARATSDNVREEIGRPFHVVAFFSHGSERGIMAQDREPFWQDGDVPDFHGSAIVAPACRAMLHLERHFARLRARVIVGHRVDLKLPPNGSELFWDRYRRLHALFPLRLLEAADIDRTRDEFYRLGTEAFEEVKRHGGGLIEMISLLQSRDDVVVCSQRDALGTVS